MTLQYSLFLLLLFSLSAVAGNTDRINISAFAAENLSGWKSKEFNGQTQYQVIPIDGIVALRADSIASASGLVKEQRIDLQQTPYLNWSWRIENRLGDLNEQEKHGDDYAARIYIIIDGGWTFWRTKAINYVWSNTSAKGKTWPNAFAGDHAMMIAIRSDKDQLNTWYSEKRNVLEDLRQAYGKEMRFIDAVALMTDTDNAQGKATAFYSHIYFSAN